MWYVLLTTLVGAALSFFAVVHLSSHESGTGVEDTPRLPVNSRVLLFLGRLHNAIFLVVLFTVCHLTLSHSMQVGKRVDFFSLMFRQYFTWNMCEVVPRRRETVSGSRHASTERLV